MTNQQERHRTRMGRPRYKHDWKSIRVGWRGSIKELAEHLQISAQTLRNMIHNKVIGQTKSELPPGFRAVRVSPRIYLIERFADLPFDPDDRHTTPLGEALAKSADCIQREHLYALAGAVAGIVYERSGGVQPLFLTDEPGVDINYTSDYEGNVSLVESHVPVALLQAAALAVYGRMRVTPIRKIREADGRVVQQFTVRLPVAAESREEPADVP